MKLYPPQKIAIYLTIFGFGIVVGYFIQGFFSIEVNPFLQGVLTGTSIVGVVGVVFELLPFLVNWWNRRRKERSHDIQRLTKHTTKLIPELKKWAKQPLTTSNELPFLMAQQHIMNGYMELRNIIEGKEGIKNTDSQYNANEKSTTKYIRDVFKKQNHEELPKFESATINDLVGVIKRFHEKQHSKGRSYTFNVIPTTSVTPNKHVLQSKRDDGLGIDNHLIGDKEDLLTLAETANSLLKDSFLQEMTETQETLGHQIHELRIAFKQKIHSIIEGITYSITDEDKIILGKCKKCKSIKEKWKID